MSLSKVLNHSGVNNFNYSVLVHYSFIYSCIHCLYLIINFFFKVHGGMESITACNGQKEGQCCQVASPLQQNCWWSKHLTMKGKYFFGWRNPDAVRITKQVKMNWPRDMQIVLHVRTLMLLSDTSCILDQKTMTTPLISRQDAPPRKLRCDICQRQ